MAAAATPPEDEGGRQVAAPTWARRWVDGRYEYRCEAGHYTVTDEPFMDACPVPVHPDGRIGVHVDQASCVACQPCGADTGDRIVPYAPQPDAASQESGS